MRLTLAPVRVQDKAEFLRMAQQYYLSLNSAFRPSQEWTRDYFRSVRTGRNLSARWIHVNGQRAGFSIFGTTRHLFLSKRKIGNIYELFVVPKFRRQQIAKKSAKLIFEVLGRMGAHRIQLEIMPHNKKAKLLWKKLGFKKTAERYVFNKK